MNYMKQIAQMLGVELGEEFKIKDPKNGEILNIIFEFDNSGLVRRAPRLEQIWTPDSEGLHQLLIGGFEIVKKPWKPSRGLRYYYVTPIKTLDHTVFDSSSYWHVTAYEADMETEVNCACCGKQIAHGDAYCSMEIHTQLGFGYDVCEECYAEEIKRRMENERQCQEE